jgi:hypothetical protein
VAIETDRPDILVLKLEGDLDLDSTDEVESILSTVPRRNSCPFGP